MADIVCCTRRTPHVLSIDGPEKDLPLEKIGSPNIQVESRLSIGVEPKVQLEWKVTPDYWKRGFRLMVFRNMDSFCPEDDPDNLLKHGELIMERHHDGRNEEFLAEGTYYYTFVLFRQRFKIIRQSEILRFALTVPSLKVARGRIKDRAEVRELLEKEIISPIAFHTKVNQAKTDRVKSRRELRKARFGEEPVKKEPKPQNAILEKQMKIVDAMIEAALAEPMAIERVKDDPRFTQLTETQQKELFKRIKARLHTGEVSARSDV